MTVHSKIKVVLVDFDGVIRHWLRDIGTLELDHGMKRGEIEQAAFSASLLEPAIRGEVSDAQWREEIVRVLGRLYPHKDLSRLVAMWSGYCGSVDTEILRLLDLCRHTALIVLTTNATSRLKTDLQSLGINEHFDSVINSSDVGFIKPEPAYFKQALKIAGVNASEAVFVDDSIGNVTQAAELGINSHHFLDISSLEAFFIDNGVMTSK